MIDGTPRPLGRLHGLLYCLIAGPYHALLMPLAFLLYGYEGVDDVNWHFWQHYPGGDPR